MKINKETLTALITMGVVVKSDIVERVLSGETVYLNIMLG